MVGIMNAATLTNFLWMSSSGQSSTQHYSWQLLSTKHRPKRLAHSSSGGVSPQSSLQARVHSLQATTAEVAKKLAELETDKLMLQQENENLLQQLVKLRESTGADFTKICVLASQISELCHRMRLRVQRRSKDTVTKVLLLSKMTGITALRWSRCRQR